MVESSEKTGIYDPRAVYTPPCVVRMTDLKQGAGDCNPAGSGDSMCTNGHTAACCDATGSGYAHT